MREHDTGSLDRPEIHIISIHEGDDEDTEDISVGECLCHLDLRETAEETREAVTRGLTIFSERKEIEEVLLELGIALEDDRILRSLQEGIPIDIATEGHEFSIDLHRVSHRDILRMTGQWDDISSFEYRELIEDRLSDLGECRTISTRIIAISTTFTLNGLEGDTTDAGLTRREFEDLPDLMIILSFLHDNDECRRDIILIQVLDGLHTDLREIYTTDFFQIVLVE